MDFMYLTWARLEALQFGKIRQKVWEATLYLSDYEKNALLERLLDALQEVEGLTSDTMKDILSARCKHLVMEITENGVTDDVVKQVKELQILTFGAAAAADAMHNMLSRNTLRKYNNENE